MISRPIQVLLTPLIISNQYGEFRIFHYAFFESTSDPTNKPVVIWFGGGPGCSCMLGLIREIGPYVIEKFGNTFEANPYSLHHLANILYLDVPAGVGYS